MKNTQKAYVALFITIILWSSAFIGIRYDMLSFSAGGLACLRYVFASLAIIYPFMTSVSHKTIPNKKDILGFLLLGFIGFAIYNVALNLGERTIDASEANFIIAQVPLIISIISVLFLKEKLTVIAWSGFFISLFGATIMLFSHGGSININFGLALLYIACIANASYALGQKFFLQKYSPIEITAYMMWAGTLPLLFYLPQSVISLYHSSWKSIIIIIYLGVFPGAIAYLCWAYAFKYINASKASSVMYFMPMITIIFAWIFLAEKTHIITAIGGFIAMFGSFVINKSKEKTIIIK